MVAPSVAAGPPDPEVALALAYAPAAARKRLKALWAFDAQLAAIVRTTRESVLGQLRLTWWHNAITAAPPPAGQPLATAIVAADLPPAALTAMIDGWEALLDADDDAGLTTFAEGRGGGLFAAAAAVLGGEGADGAGAGAGAGWALVDLARHHSRAEVRERALRLAAERLATVPRRWRRPLRPLGMLAKLARRDLAGLEAQGSPRRLAAMALLALTGR